MSALLQTITFKDCTNWSVAHLLVNQFNYNKAYPLVKIGEFLTRSKNRIEIEDDIEYKRVTIRMNNNGIALRDRVMGKDIGTKKQFLIKKGQFLLSKIDARNGAFGLATDEVDGAIITADFFAYDIDESQIEPYFLVLMTTTEQFKRFAQGASSGTTGRQRIDEKRFLDVKIPLPSLGKQREIVDNYHRKINLAIGQEKLINNKEKRIHEYLTKKLGIEVSLQEKDNKLLQFSKFQNLSNWNIIENLKKKKFHFGKSKTKKISEILILKSGDFLPKSKQKGKSFLVYGGNGINGHHNKYNNSGKKIVIGRVGEYCGNIHLVEGYYWITDNALIGDIINNINIDYLAIILKILNLNQYKSISGQPSLSQTNIKDIDVPCPSINDQTTISDYVKSVNNEISELKDEASENRIFALNEFEREIFDEA